VVESQTGRTARADTFYDQIGGHETFVRLVDRFY
jgi:truncated hemoglobin YjbI